MRPRGQRLPVWGPRIPSPVEVRIISAALLVVVAVVAWTVVAGAPAPRPQVRTSPTFVPQTVSPAVPFTEEP